MFEKYINSLKIPLVWLGTIGIAAVLTIASVVWLWFSPPSGIEAGPPTAVLTVIPWDTSTPLPTATSTASPFESDGAAATLAPGELGIGSLVQIVGTNGEGLNIRSAPGLSSEVFFLGYDAEVFIVSDGPVEMDGFTWWYLVTPVDESRSGWAAATYLAVIENP
ncbi:MAG: SH3 domain-containing protein [Anaerolineae bacterium]|nr:SH3 domain-containing protein [Anaerolineae bacterium]